MILPSCLAARDDGTLLLVAVVPNARRTAVDGLHDGALRVRLAAPPVEGRANDALIAWLAKSLGLARREVVLLRGEASRRKQLVVAAPPVRVAAWVGDQLAGQP